MCFIDKPKTNKRQYQVKATAYDKRGRIIAVGYNDYGKTHTKQAHYSKRTGSPEKVFLHAEIAALIKCRRQPYKLKIERYGVRGEPRLAKPCPACDLAIREAGVKYVEYTVG